MSDLPPSHQPPYDPHRYGGSGSYDYSLREPGYGQPPVKPGVTYVFVGYCVLLMIAGLAVAAMGLLCRMDPQGILEMQSQSVFGQQGLTQADVMAAGTYYLVVGALYVLAPLVWFFLPRSSVKWAAALPVMALSVLTCCCTPVALVLLLFWVLPSTRSYYMS